MCTTSYKWKCQPHDAWVTVGPFGVPFGVAYSAAYKSKIAKRHVERCAMHWPINMYANNNYNINYISQSAISLSLSICCDAV